MRGWCGSRGLSIALAFLLCSCAAQKTQEPAQSQEATEPKPLSENFRDGLARLRSKDAHALEAGVARQSISPEAEAAKRAAATSMRLQPGEKLWLQSGKSRVIRLSSPVRRVAIGDPDLASIVVLDPLTIVINAKQVQNAPGTAAGGGGAGSASVASLTTVRSVPMTPQPRLAETTLVIWTADGRGEQADSHTLIVADFLAQQVMLEVTVAEVDRTALEIHGIDWRVLQEEFFAAGFMGSIAPVGSVIPGQPLFPLTLGEGSTYAFVWPDEDVAIVLQLLQQEGLANILAQPKIMALSGQPALFQSGGEIPIRIATGFAADVEFKPFGTIVNFVPRVSEDGDIMLTVTPEVSEPDYGNRVEGIPTFRTRRASTSAKLRNGETLVLGGLLQSNTLEQVKGVPYLKDIPFLGYAFRRTEYQTQIQELMVLVTPRIVEPLAPGTEVALPIDAGPMTWEEQRTKPDPATVSRPRIPLLP